MRQLFALLTAVLAFSAALTHAAVFSTSPGIIQLNSENVKIIFNSAESGNPTLQEASALYAHIGVTLPSAPQSWTYVKGSWSENTADKKFTRRADGLWELNIGDIATYFGLKKDEKVAAIAVIARTPDGKAQTADNFLPLNQGSFEIALTSNPGNSFFLDPTTVSFTASASEPSAITVAVDGTEIASHKGATDLTASYSFNETGRTYTVTATATNGASTLSKETKVTVTGLPKQAPYPGGVPRQGAVRNPDGTVTFCLLAPGKQTVMLMPSWSSYQPSTENFMNYQDYEGARYFWTTTPSPLSASEYYPYFYIVDGSVSVADPYARLILDPQDSNLPASCFPGMPEYPAEAQGSLVAVYRGDIDDYKWDSATLNFSTPDLRNLTIYEMLIRDFAGDGSDQNGHSFGTFRSAMEHIPYLRSLGVNAVEIMPVMEFNGNQSWGYNTNAYMALDKAYGSPRDMRDFISECHREGIAVILDIVLNQSDGLHPWYRMYPADNNPFYNASAPHAYSVLNDWKQENPLVEQHWVDVLTYWLEAYKVDGFRFDLVKGLGDTSSYGTTSNADTDRTNSTRVARMKRLHEAMKRVKPDVIHINELLGSADEENANGADGQMNWSKVTDAAADFAKGSGTKAGATSEFHAANRGRRVGETVDYAESHDEMRLARQILSYGHSSVRYTSMTESDSKAINAINRLGAVAAQMLLTPGAKMIWQFGELAADDVQGSDLNKLRPIAPKWDHLDNPLRASLHQVYTQLCNLRKKNPDLFSESATYTITGFSADFNTVRSMRIASGSREVVAFFNPAVNGTPRQVAASAGSLTPSNSELIAASYGTEPTLSVADNIARVTLKPHEFAVYATKSVNSIGSTLPDGRPDITVSGAEGRIEITGNYTTAEVYNLEGMRLPSLSVAPGLYIVRVDGTVHKVLVH